MADQFTNVTETSWIERLTSSIKGVLFGTMCVTGAFGLLWWNEGNLVAERGALGEAKTKLIIGNANTPNPQQNGKLLYLYGALYSPEFVDENELLGKLAYLKLERHVEMYQWVEEKKESTEKNAGGSTKKTTTYTYKQDWSKKHNNSNNFHEPSGHDNPKLPFSTTTVQVSQATFGKFDGKAILSRVENYEDVVLSNENLKKGLEHNLLTKYQLVDRKVNVKDNRIYITKSGSVTPENGDIRVFYRGIKAGYFSAITQQTGNNGLEAFQSSNSKEIFLVEPGKVSPELLMKHEASRQNIMSWIWRAVGLLMMWIGLSMMLSPFVVLFDVLPILGDIAGLGVGLFAAILSVTLGTLIIATAWLPIGPSTS
ncbi:MAG: TMEM43 family protein [Bdellovibrionales bacterium]|nr:TMEM43 family protein [Bdellovibrionales bacterium]